MKIMCIFLLKLWQMYENFIEKMCRKTTRNRPVARPTYRWSTIQSWTSELHHDLYSSAHGQTGSSCGHCKKKPTSSSFSGPSKKPLPSPEEFCPMCFVRERTHHTKVSRLAWKGYSEKTVHRWASLFKIHDRNKRDAPSFNTTAVGTTTL